MADHGGGYLMRFHLLVFFFVYLCACSNNGSASSLLGPDHTPGKLAPPKDEKHSSVEPEFQIEKTIDVGPGLFKNLNIIGFKDSFGVANNVNANQVKFRTFDLYGNQIKEFFPYTDNIYNLEATEDGNLEIWGSYGTAHSDSWYGLEVREPKTGKIIFIDKMASYHFKVDHFEITSTGNFGMTTLRKLKTGKKKQFAFFTTNVVTLPDGAIALVERYRSKKDNYYNTKFHILDSDGDIIREIEFVRKSYVRFITNDGNLYAVNSVEGSIYANDASLYESTIDKVMFKETASRNLDLAKTTKSEALDNDFFSFWPDIYRLNQDEFDWFKVYSVSKKVFVCDFLVRRAEHNRVAYSANFKNFVLISGRGSKSKIIVLSSDCKGMREFPVPNLVNISLAGDRIIAGTSKGEILIIKFSPIPLFKSPTTSTTDISQGEYIRNSNGGILNGFRVEEAAQACVDRGKRLPTAREIATEATKYGAKILEVTEAPSINPDMEGYSMIRVKNSDGTFDSFYYNPKNYRKPPGDLGKSSGIWLSSSELKTGLYMSMEFRGWDGVIYIDSMYIDIGAAFCVP